MNLLRKSSMILLGAVAASALALACAEGDSTGSDTAEVTEAVADGLVIAQLYVQGDKSAAGALDGSYLELFNASNDKIALKDYALQIQAKNTPFDPAKAIDLGTAEIAAHSYYLISLTSGASLGLPPFKVDLTIADHASDIDATAGSIAIAPKKALCKDDGCTDAVDIVGYGAEMGKAAAGNQPAQVGQARLNGLAPALSANGSQALVRLGGGCVDAQKNDTDFTLAAPKPLASTDPVKVCAALSASDAGDAATDASSDAAQSDAGDGGGKPKPAKDASTADAAKGDDDKGDDDNSTAPPPPTSGKKKTTSTANTPPQPIAASSPSCSTTSGPASAGGFAGLAGLGLALTALGRRRRK